MFQNLFALEIYLSAVQQVFFFSFASKSAVNKFLKPARSLCYDRLLLLYHIYYQLQLGLCPVAVLQLHKQYVNSNT
jgi:hypothetical protein